MIITIPWLKEHLKTNAKESEIIDKLTNIGLEVEGIKENSGEMGKFKIAILNFPISPEFSLMPSTSSPIFVNLSIISLSLAFVFKCSLSQGIVIIICLAPCSLLEHLMGQIQNDLAIYSLLQRKLLNR